ncbi:MAG: MFS transporter [Candidatus Binatia bacterium]
MDSHETDTRWTILWLLVLISVVRSMDAVNFSVAAKQIMPEYGLSHVQMGLLYTSFTLGYALFHVPGGWLGDTFGPRRVLTAAVLWWSVFTALTALAGQGWLAALFGPVGSFMVVRFCIGMGESAGYPTANRAIASWMAPNERARAVGLLLAGMGIGYGLAPPIVSWIMIHRGWRAAFYVFGLLGIALAAWWYAYATDAPEEHPRVSAAELRRIRSAGPVEKRPTPWRAILTHRDVLLLTLAMFGYGYGGYVFQSWFYLYLVDVRGFSVLQAGWLTAAPFVAITIFGPLGGALSDALGKRYGITVGRRAVAMSGFVLAALCLYTGALVADGHAAVFLLALAAGSLYFGGAAMVAACIDIGGPHSGTIYGVTVTLFQLAGVVAPTLTPIVAERFGWTAALQLAALVALGTAGLWLLINPANRIEAAEDFSRQRRRGADIQCSK